MVYSLGTNSEYDRKLSCIYLLYMCRDSFKRDSLPNITKQYDFYFKTKMKLKIVKLITNSRRGDF